MEQKELIGKIISDVVYDKSAEDISFVMNDDSKFKMLHNQDCCESVSIDWKQSCDLNDLKGKEILSFSELSTEGDGSSYGSCTITTYTFFTPEGNYKIVWEGESNGYYSETPEFYKEE